MISALIEHNTSDPSPSQLFEAGEIESGPTWNGGGPGEMRPIFDRSHVRPSSSFSFIDSCSK